MTTVHYLFYIYIYIYGCDLNDIFFILSCATQVNSLDSACKNCVLLYSESNITICESLPASRFDTNYGLLLLSRKELKNTNVAPYNSQSQFRAYLEASVSVQFIVHVHYHCKIRDPLMKLLN